MPKTRISEWDRTGTIAQAPIANTIYIPIKTAKAYPIVNDRNQVQALFTSKAKLDEVFDSTYIPDDDDYTESEQALKIAKHLINLGFTVIVEGIASEDNRIPDSSVKILKDKGLVDVRFLTTGYEIALNTQLKEIADAREDCIALMSGPDNTTDVTDLRRWFDEEGLVSAYAAAYAPWFIGNVDGELIEIPAAYAYLFAYGNMLKSGAPETNAVAGPIRGIIPELVDVLYDYTSADIERLQGRAADQEVALDAETDNVGFAINPIANIRPSGYIIYGNRTLKINDAVKKTTAQSFLNIRNGVNAVKKVLYEASRRYVFEQNTEVLWIDFRNYVTPLLDRMKSNGAILGYTFEKVETSAKARLRARLTIIPIEAVEDFEIDVYLVDDLKLSE